MKIPVPGKIKPVLYLVLCLCFPAIVVGQANQNPDTRLQNSRLLLEGQKYDLAMAELLPILIGGETFEKKPQVLYLYSVAALKAKKYTEGNTRITQLLQQHPTWPFIEEARYVAANIAFEQKDYNKALQLLQEVNAPDLAKDESAMKQTYLATITNKPQLQALVRQYPDDKDVATIYANKLVSGWYTEKDKGTLEDIVKRFDLDKQKYTVKSGELFKKDQYNVAVLLPFQLGQTTAIDPRFTDLYAGMLLARDSLATNGIKLNMFTYDAPADTNKVRTILNLPEMKAMDLIIGPVYKNANKLISKFAQQNQIIAINPLSEDIDLVKNNPFLYLYNASRITQARQSAAFAYQNFSPKTAVVVYSNSEEGIAFARAYRMEFEKRGGKVLANKPVSPSGSGTGVYAGIDFSAVGHILVASNHAGLAYNTLSNLERLPNKIPVITYASWLDITQLSLKQLDDQEIYFLNPKFVDTSLPIVRQFRSKYSTRYNNPPSEYAYTGFDLLYYFGNVLARNGSKFNTALSSEGAISGVFFQGIGYGPEHDNQYVPILKLENLQLNVVNPVFK